MFRWILVSSLTVLACAKAPYVRIATPTPYARIVGGVGTTIEKYPYQTSIQLDGRHLCGGCLIAPDLVVTAAHCIDDMEPLLQYMSVRAGSTLRDEGGVVLKIKSMHIHPDYNLEFSSDYDVSVLILHGSFPLSYSINLIPLQDVDVEVPDQKLATVTGWGLLKMGGPPSLNLQAVDVPKVDDNICASFYIQEDITDRMHCFGYLGGGKDSCQGDSGGPLVVDGKLAGIISWGYGCGLPFYLGVYTKVANAEINEYLRSFLTHYI